jgi:O-antigen ligase
MIAAVLTSQSRGGAIGLIVVLLLLIAVPARALFRSRRQKLVGILCVVAAGAALIIHSPWAVLPRLETITGSPKNGAAAGSGRVEIWKAAAHSIRDHPLFGTGYGSFVYQSDYLMLNTNGVDLTYFYLRTPGSEAHNLYLGTWAELGLPGLLLYLGLMAATARSLRRTAVRAGRLGEDVVRRLANGLLLGLVSWAVTSFFLTTETARAFWIILGLSLALPRFLPGEQRSAQRAS